MVKNKEGRKVVPDGRGGKTKERRPDEVLIRGMCTTVQYCTLCMGCFLEEGVTFAMPDECMI